ncbi:hypothetical protein TRICHSKD4_4563 [Roseibium sp. TrichSKD4]|uniref:hypothetical protein n=1 Tax=Roseibium sp. TrichSKD4 TaxID=744980 RepID=UPI0001E5761B|nr:hypothetical protein [Roseibium sp. TrichSKD4]EFO30962.1 hypothetical protein TRICHSKD4_4563 [Roseibium sp. TrichSKD4]
MPLSQNLANLGAHVHMVAGRTTQDGDAYRFLMRLSQLLQQYCEDCLELERSVVPERLRELETQWERETEGAVVIQFPGKDRPKPTPSSPDNGGAA